MTMAIASSIVSEPLNPKKFSISFEAVGEGLRLGSSAPAPPHPPR